jgi:urease accessory protein
MIARREGAWVGAGPAGSTGLPGLPGLLGLLQLADSCFPAGGFAFSNGLEALAKSGRIRGLGDFREYLASYLSQAASADLPFLNSAWAAAGGPAAGVPAGLLAPGETLEDVALEWGACLSLPAPRRASLAMGQAWLRAMEGAHGGPVAALRPRFRAESLPAHFLVAFGASLRAVGTSLADTQALFLHMALRDQLGAAVRLGLVGSLQAQGLHRESLARAEALRRRHVGQAHRQSRKTAPMIEMGQAGHPYLYSRLFQS